MPADIVHDHVDMVLLDLLPAEGPSLLLLRSEVTCLLILLDDGVNCRPEVVKGGGGVPLGLAAVHNKLHNLLANAIRDHIAFLC